MKNLKELNEYWYESIESFKAEDQKPFEFKICIEIIDLHEVCGDTGYLISVNACKLPQYISDEHKQSIQKMVSSEDEITVQDICHYGIYPPFDSFKIETLNEMETKLSELDTKLFTYGMLCGFYLDKTVNRIGNTGWDFINGIVG